MLPILIILLLAQSLSAANEFPDLMQNIKVTWDGVDISSQLDARLTSSLDKQVDYFLLCGPWQTFHKGGDCRVETHYEIHYSETNITRITGFTNRSVGIIGDLYRNNTATFTCLSFLNLIPNFKDYMQHTWYGNFTCETAKLTPKPIPKPEPETKSDSKPMGVYVIGVVIGMAIIGYIAFEIGKKKGAESSQGNPSSGAYKALGANNKVYGGNTSYGNPFAQTA